MTKQEYIQLRVEQKYYFLIYLYFVEKSLTTLDYQKFGVLFDTWLKQEEAKSFKNTFPISRQEALDFILDGVFSHFDGKFEIMYIVTHVGSEKRTLIM